MGTVMVCRLRCVLFSFVFPTSKCVLTGFVKSSDQLVSFMSSDPARAILGGFGRCPVHVHSECPVHVHSNPMVHGAHWRLLRLCRCVRSCDWSMSTPNVQSMSTPTRWCMVHIGGC